MIIFRKIKPKHRYTYKTIILLTLALFSLTNSLVFASQENNPYKDLYSEDNCTLELPENRKEYQKPNMIIGEILIHKVRKGETLYDIARNYDIGSKELICANLGIDPWIPSEGVSLLIPSMHVIPSTKCEGIIINTAELRLYYFPRGCESKYILTFPISIGKSTHTTPFGTTYIIKKQKDPFWVPPASIKKMNPSLPKIIPPGDKNPLGRYALYLGWPSILIHGTNKPWGIGSMNTHGCISMYPEDIKLLFTKIKIGTIVHIINEPVKIGCREEDLYIEVSSTQEQISQLDLSSKIIMNSDLEIIKRSITNQYNNIKENILDNALQKPQGFPIKIN